MSRRRQRPISGFKRARGYRLEVPHREAPLAFPQPLALLQVECAGRAGRDCGRLLFGFFCESRPHAEHEVFMDSLNTTGQAPVSHGDFRFTVEPPYVWYVKCGACGARFGPFLRREAMTRLQALVDSGRKKDRVSVADFEAQSL